MFISQLISMGIYNFAKDIDGIQYLYNNPNSYRDVAQYHQLQPQQVNQQINSNNGLINTAMSAPAQVINQPVVDNTIKVIGSKIVGIVSKLQHFKKGFFKFTFIKV